jgi:hypothetical protein
MIAVTFAAEIEEKVRAIAAQRGIDPSLFVASLVEQQLERYSLFEHPNGDGDDDFDPDAQLLHLRFQFVDWIDPAQFRAS